MKKEDQEIISKELGVKPHKINSALFSAQKRVRLYWTNIDFNKNIEDKNILLKDILDFEKVDISLYLSKEEFEKIKYKKSKKYNGEGKQIEGSIEFPQSLNRKSLCLLHSDGMKSTGRAVNIIKDNFGARRLTINEVEKLQTLPVDYTKIENISDNTRYKLIADGWTIDVISHILKGLKEK
jgi:site-specific DNA-cytosine methylase